MKVNKMQDKLSKEAVLMKEVHEPTVIEVQNYLKNLDNEALSQYTEKLIKLLIDVFYYNGTFWELSDEAKFLIDQINEFNKNYTLKQ